MWQRNDELWVRMVTRYKQPGPTSTVTLYGDRLLARITRRSRLFVRGEGNFRLLGRRCWLDLKSIAAIYGYAPYSEDV